jgi:hypothetical protein
MPYRKNMSKPTLEQKFETMTPARLFKWLSWILAAASVFVAGIFSFYFLTFHYELSSSNSDWGTFGDFIGGTLNPILSLHYFLQLSFKAKSLSQQEKSFNAQHPHRKKQKKC